MNNRWLLFHMWQEFVDRPFRSAPTEWDSNSLSPFPTTTSKIRSRAHCYEEGSFRGAFSWSPRMDDRLVYNTRWGASRPGVLCFGQFW
jgi:hypothetical protein